MKRQILALNGLMACYTCEWEEGERFVGQSISPLMQRDVFVQACGRAVYWARIYGYEPQILALVSSHGEG